MIADGRWLDFEVIELGTVIELIEHSRCTVSEDVDLCSYCYHKGEHGTGNVFKRKVHPNGDWEQVRRWLWLR